MLPKVWAALLEVVDQDLHVCRIPGIQQATDYTWQVLELRLLKPHQRVRVSLSDPEGTLRCGAMVVWASFEMPKDAGPRYRVALDFINPNAAALDAYIGRHTRAGG